MSSRYDFAGVLTLNCTACPRFTLMSVAKPWMVELPAPEMSQVLCGVPGLEFSHAIGFTIGVQGSAAPAAGPTTTVVTTMARAAIEAIAACFTFKNARACPTLPLPRDHAR